MRDQAIWEAILAAKRFIRDAEILRTELRESELRYVITGTKASGAARRSSMDLTRALSEMRKP